MFVLVCARVREHPLSSLTSHHTRTLQSLGSLIKCPFLASDTLLKTIWLASWKFSHYHQAGQSQLAHRPLPPGSRAYARPWTDGYTSAAVYRMYSNEMHQYFPLCRMLTATEFTEHDTLLCERNRKELYNTEWHRRRYHRRRCRCCCSSHCVFDSKINDAARCALGIHEIHCPASSLCFPHDCSAGANHFSWLAYCLRSGERRQPKRQIEKKNGDRRRSRYLDRLREWIWDWHVFMMRGCTWKEWAPTRFTRQINANKCQPSSQTESE